MLKYKITFPQEVVFFVEEELLKYMPNLEKLTKTNQEKLTKTNQGKLTKTNQEKLTKDNLDNYCKDITIGHIKGEIFSHILMYVRHLATYPNDIKFRINLIKNMKTDTLFDVIIAADYFGVKEITEYCSNMFKKIIDENDVNGMQSIFDIDDE